MKSSDRSEETIFKQALKLGLDERASFIRQACQEDQQLLARVARLLDIEKNEPDFLQEPPPGVRRLNEMAGDERLSQLIGSQIGPYTIREQIGEGAMGIVYLAEQHSPVRRKVALKVIKPGMDSKEIVSRFEAERQALAVMEHPNIARVLDAGVTDSGRSYFAMELVRGISITEYCDQVRLSMSERLHLFMDVCDAVQHAHQKGVIHRDIKPSNILVTQIDGNPVVKVIDFGLAKATGSQQLTDRTIYTGFMKLMGTPQYMSPEQVGLSGQDIDTRTDIYSLGVVLYELITGTTPLDLESIREQPYDEIIRRYLNHEPVTAVAPSIAYVVSKAIQRHRLAIATIIAFALLLLMAAIVSTVFAVRARHEANHAKTQSSRAESALVSRAGHSARSGVVDGLGHQSHGRRPAGANRSGECRGGPSPATGRAESRRMGAKIGLASLVGAA